MDLGRTQPSPPPPPPSQDVPGALSEPELAAALQLQHEPRLCCPASADSPEDAQRGLRWMVDHVQNVPPEVMDRVHRESLEEMVCPPPLVLCAISAAMVYAHLCGCVYEHMHMRVA